MFAPCRSAPDWIALRVSLVVSLTARVTTLAELLVQNLQSAVRHPERFKLEVSHTVSRSDGNLEESLILTTGRLTILGPCPDEREWRELHRQLRRHWSSYPLLGELRTEEESVLARLLGAHGPRPKPDRQGGQGLIAYWEELLSAERGAGINRWKSWLAHLPVVLRLEEPGRTLVRRSELGKSTP